MGKSVSNASRLISLAKAPIKHTKPTTPTLVQLQHNNTRNKMQSNSTSNSSEKNISTSQNGVEARLPLLEVVSDCVKRWFKDALKEAKTGDVNMQVLVAQMYYKGFGVTRDAQKGRVWMTRASRTRSSVWKVSDKHPGYNASDSDSDELNDDS